MTLTPRDRRAAAVWLGRWTHQYSPGNIIPAVEAAEDGGIQCPHCPGLASLLDIKRNRSKHAFNTKNLIVSKQNCRGLYYSIAPAVVFFQTDSFHSVAPLSSHATSPTAWNSPGA